MTEMAPVLFINEVILLDPIFSLSLSLSLRFHLSLSPSLLF
jgi:hypothetical protein